MSVRDEFKRKASALLLIGGFAALIACGGHPDYKSPIRQHHKPNTPETTFDDEGCAVRGKSLGPSDATEVGIINGQTLAPEARIARGVVFLLTQIPDDSGQLRPIGCTGVLVNEKMVLTAAHCVRTEPTLTEAARAKSTEVIFSVDPKCDALDKKDPAKRKAVAKVIYHRDYNAKGSSENDLALVFLKDPAPAGVRPLPVSLEEEDLRPETQVHVAGYGRQRDLEEENDPADLKLRYTTLFPSADTPLMVSERLLENSPGSDVLILDTDRGTAACQGDSGGPAIVDKVGRLTVVGVASIVYDKDNQRRTCQSRVAYTRPSAFRAWLNENSNGAFQLPP